MVEPSGQQDDRAVVSYSVKELLQDIKGSVDKLYGKMDGKAEQKTVEVLATALSVERSRIDTIEHSIAADNKARSQQSEWRRYVVPMVLTLALLFVAVVQLVVTR